MLHIQLLGGFQITHNQQPVTAVNQASQQSLLAYLLLHAHTPQSRQHLAFLFWPDSTAKQARTNLRHQLHQIQHKLPILKDYLRAESGILQWRSDAQLKLDVASFEQKVSQAENLSQPALIGQKLEDAIALYQGQLLPGCYDAWVFPIRERLQQQYLTTLEALTVLKEENRDYVSAIRFAQALLEQDPVHEVTYRRLMRLYALNGDTTRALQVYHTCVDALDEHLAVDPEPDTHLLYKRLSSRTALTEQDKVVETHHLIGRQPEWHQLQTAWMKAEQGQTYFALISGEAGIGKTYLASALLDWGDRLGITTARSKAYSAEGRLVFAPVTEWLRTPVLKRRYLSLGDVWLSELSRLLPEILEERPDLSAPTPLTDQWQRQYLFETLARAVLIDATPLLLLIDDLQWCDQDTLEWLHYLLRFDSQKPLLVVGTVRPEEVTEQHPLTTLLLNLRMGNQLTEINLEGLNASETAELATQAASQVLTNVQTQRLHRETGGVPLFAVEIVRAGIHLNEQGLSTGVQVHSLPHKVYVVLQARLKQLSPKARELIGLAAVIGREFSINLLVEANGTGTDQIVQPLEELWQKRIIQVQDQDRYDFTHDLIREVAYTEVNPIRRRQYHWRIIQALETLYEADLDSVSGQLAAHCEQAGLTKEAIVYYQQAGSVAHRVYANVEAVNYFQQGLALLNQLPPSLERDKHKLSLYLSLGVPLVALHGYAAEQVREMYLQANVLAQRINEAANGPILRALSIACLTRGEFQQAIEYGQQMLERAIHNQDTVLIMEAYYALGVTTFWQSDYDASRTYLEQAIMHYDIENCSKHIQLFAQDPLPICQARLAGTLWFLGYLDQAEMWISKALASAKVENHPQTMAYVLQWVAFIHHFQLDIEQTLITARESTEYSERYQLPFWAGSSKAALGWAQIQQGDLQTGIKTTEDSLNTLQKGDASFNFPYFSSFIAEAKAKLGQVNDGLAILTNAVDQAKIQGGRWCLVEIFRLKGDLLLQQSAPIDEVETLYQQAIEIARQQKAKSWELRVTLSLCELWKGQGNIKQARQQLTAIYGWFSEGFDTPLMRKAKALLDELA